MKLNSSAFNEVVAKISNTLNISVQSVKPLGKGYASIFATVNQPDATNEQIVEAFLDLMDGKAKIIPDTLRPVEAKAGVNLCRFIAAPNTESQRATDEVVAGMKAVTANVFIDNTNNIWKMVGDGEERRLVLESKDNLDDLYQQRQSRMMAVAGLSHDMEFGNGDYVMYASTLTDKLSGGFILNTEAGLCIFDRDQMILANNVNPTMIVAAAPAVNLNSDEFKELEFENPVEHQEVATTLTSERANRLIAYYRKIYSSKPGLMEKFEAMIRNSVSPARQIFNRPVMQQYYKSNTGM